MSLKVHKFKDLQIFYRKGTEDEKVINHSFENDIFYKEIPSFNPQGNPTIIDVGAHIGTFSLLSAFRYPEAKIFSVEASKETFDVLKKNITINNLRNIVPIHAALSDKEELVKLYHCGKIGNWGHSITKKLSDSFEETKSISLETLIETENINQIDLIKFNCEGAEFEILLNVSKESLKKINLGLILYHEDLVDGKHNCLELINLFKLLDFRILKIEKSLKRGWLVVWNKNRYSWFYFFICKIKSIKKRVGL